MTAGLAIAPTGALAEPTQTKPDTVETFESLTVTSRARLGVLAIQLTPELRKHYGTAADRGVLVGRVEPRSAAASAGLAVGDVITDVRGTVVDDASDVIAALAGTKAGDKITLSVVRAGKPLALTATMPETSGPTSTLERAWPTWFRELFERIPRGDRPLPDRKQST
ncbi:MAG TPA: PDZ domain-containing protein [Kofleriaceae bacterium]|nr:PDZ domain-containing protein [Kofleriaceae bacterium]